MIVSQVPAATDARRAFAANTGKQGADAWRGVMNYAARLSSAGVRRPGEIVRHASVAEVRQK